MHVHVSTCGAHRPALQAIGPTLVHPWCVFQAYNAYRWGPGLSTASGPGAGARRGPGLPWCGSFSCHIGSILTPRCLIRAAPLHTDHTPQYAVNSSTVRPVDSCTLGLWAEGLHTLENIHMLRFTHYFGNNQITNPALEPDFGRKEG